MLGDKGNFSLKTLISFLSFPFLYPNCKSNTIINYHTLEIRSHILKLLLISSFVFESICMATNQKPTFPLRLLVDKERKRVVVAEASGDFIDILFSFLTLPLGTIIRLVYNDQPHDKLEDTVGCINNLYRSIESLDAEVFCNHICQQMLLYPRNPCEELCQKLKLKVDDTEPTRYFMCSGCRKGSDWLLSTFAGSSCSCGKLMDREMKLLREPSEETHGDGVFVKGGTMFLIFDDLKVLQSSPGNSVKQLVQLGYRNFNKLTEMSLNVGLKEILDLLKQASISKSPLSNVFLANGESKQMYTFSPKPGAENAPRFSSCINIKVTVRKSKILYAEAEGDFVDFLFSFLTTPLGSILKLLDGNISLGCMDNLYKSVKDLNSSWFITPFSTCTPLLNLRLAPQFGCYWPPVKLCEVDTPSYWYGTGVIKNNLGYVIGNGVISKNRSLVENPGAMKLFEPRSPDGAREHVGTYPRKHAVGFVRRPSLFVVWDDLQVTPFADTSSISFLQKLNVPLDDLEEHVVGIGEAEALNLLGASLTSKAALTEGLFYLLKKPKEETKA